MEGSELGDKIDCSHVRNPFEPCAAVSGCVLQQQRQIEKIDVIIVIMLTARKSPHRIAPCSSPTATAQISQINNVE